MRRVRYSLLVGCQEGGWFRPSALDRRLSENSALTAARLECERYCAGVEVALLLDEVELARFRSTGTSPDNIGSEDITNDECRETQDRDTTIWDDGQRLCA